MLLLQLLLCSLIYCGNLWRFISSLNVTIHSEKTGCLTLSWLTIIYILFVIFEQQSFTYSSLNIHDSVLNKRAQSRTGSLKQLEIIHNRSWSSLCVSPMRTCPPCLLPTVSWDRLQRISGCR